MEPNETQAIEAIEDASVKFATTRDQSGHPGIPNTKITGFLRKTLYFLVGGGNKVKI